jgi:hypothetical protein
MVRSLADTVEGLDATLTSRRAIQGYAPLGRPETGIIAPWPTDRSSRAFAARGAIPRWQCSKGSMR